MPDNDTTLDNQMMLFNPAADINNNNDAVDGAIAMRMQKPVGGEWDSQFDNSVIQPSQEEI